MAQTPLRIGLDVTSALDPRPTGVARYVIGLARALQALAEREGLEVEIFLRPSHLRRARLPDALAHLRRRWLLPWRPHLGLDLFHAPDLRLPGWSVRASRIVTIHDLTHFEGSAHAPPRFLRRKRAQLRAAFRDAAAIITHSESVRSAICSLHAVAGERVFAIPLADSLLSDCSHASRQPDRLLLVGGPSPRKGSDRLPELLALWREQLKWEPRIDWVGSGEPRLAAELISRLPVPARGHVRFLGHVTDQRLATLYRECTGLLSLSFQEGFGLPLLEAAGRGCPVIARSTPVLHETLGESAFWMDDSAESCVEAGRLFRLPEERSLRARSAALRASAFGWDRTARATLAVYRRVAGAGSQRRG